MNWGVAKQRIRTLLKCLVLDAVVRDSVDFETFRLVFFFVPLCGCGLFTNGVMISINRTVRQRESLALKGSKKRVVDNEGHSFDLHKKKNTYRSSLACGKTIPPFLLNFQKPHQLLSRHPSLRHEQAKQHSGPAQTRKERRT
jgi:hypothetical protein